MNNYAINPDTGFPVVPEGQLWRVRKLCGNYTSYDRSEFDVYEDLYIAGESVIVELVEQWTEKKPTREGHYIFNDGGYAPPTPDSSGVFWDEDYQYKLKQTGYETVQDTRWVGVFRPRQVTTPVQRPTFEKVYLMQDREKILESEFSRRATTVEMQMASFKILDKVAAKAAREAVLGDYPPKKLELI